MDQTTKWLIRIMSVVVIGAIGGGFYIFGENNKRAKKLEAESYCKNDYSYRQNLSLAAKAIQLEQLQSETGFYSKKSKSLPSSYTLYRRASDSYDKCLERRLKVN